MILSSQEAIPQELASTVAPAVAMSPAITSATPQYVGAAPPGKGLAMTPPGLGSLPLMMPAGPMAAAVAEHDLAALQVNPAVIAAEATIVGDDEEDTKL